MKQLRFKIDKKSICNWKAEYLALISLRHAIKNMLFAVGVHKI